MVVFIKAKKALIKRSAFSKLLPNLVQPLISPCKLFYIKIIEKVVAQALMTQAIINAFGSIKIKFFRFCK